ncbi:MAG: PIG-L deacetylase family protein [Planctomycetota bacterium]
MKGLPKEPRVTTTVPAGPVLVFAPHPDDEIVGPGATLMKHVAQGDQVSVVIIFDGQRGDPEGHYADQDLCALRQAESRLVATQFLKTEDVFFHAFADGLTEGELDRFYPGLPDDPEEKLPALLDGLAGLFREHIERTNPTTIYYPWQGEVHADHWACAEAMTRLLKADAARFAEISVMGYEVWSTLLPEVLVDVSEVFDQKMEAMSLYHTQTRYVDYPSLVKGLNRHRSYLMPHSEVPHDRRYAEAFVGEFRHLEGDKDAGRTS